MRMDDAGARPNYAILQNNPMDRKIASKDQLLDEVNVVHFAVSA
jgi:hypothetical protein